MELREYVRVLRRAWLVVLVFMLAGLGVAALLALVQTPRYTATTQLFFGVGQGKSVTDLTQGSTFTERQMSAYGRVATSPLVLDRVIQDLNLNTTPTELAKEVTAEPVASVILAISATDTDAGQAARIANSVGKELAATTVELVAPGGAGSQVQTTILTPATAPTSPSSPVLIRYLAVGLALGLLLGVGASLLRHFRNANVRNLQDVRSLTDSEVLGVVPSDSAARQHPLAIRDDPSGSRAEAVRRLRTNLHFAHVAARVSSIAVTSSIPEEGRTTLAVNLAVSFADGGLRVVLVDADLRRPKAASLLSLDADVGLTSVLSGHTQLESAVRTWAGSSLDVLPAGPLPPNPSELLGSKEMSALMERLSSTYDVVLLDSPPVLPVTDALVLSKLARGTLVVVGLDQIRRPQLQEALESLQTVEANVLGLVLNKVAKSDTSAFVHRSPYTSAAHSR
jgi:succinoglycan biosynthesis transport protein ExoP